MNQKLVFDVNYSMLDNSPDSFRLIQNAIKNSLFPKLIMQLEKDFALANIPIELTTEIAPTNLKETLHEKLYHLMMEKFPEYLNLLYIVDVPEKEFNKIQVTDVVEVAEQVTFLILKRELQKVWLKNKYSR